MKIFQMIKIKLLLTIHYIKYIFITNNKTKV